MYAVEIWSNAGLGAVRSVRIQSRTHWKGGAGAIVEEAGVKLDGDVDGNSSYQFAKTLRASLGHTCYPWFLLSLTASHRSTVDTFVKCSDFHDAARFSYLQRSFFTIWLPMTCFSSFVLHTRKHWRSLLAGTPARVLSSLTRNIHIHGVSPNLDRTRPVSSFGDQSSYVYDDFGRHCSSTSSNHSGLAYLGIT